MQVVTSWTGDSADKLRQALRMGNESFADYLGVSVRTVANWRKERGIVPKPMVQGMLDTALDRAPERAKVQFALLVEGDNESDSALTPDDQERIDSVIRNPSRLDAPTVEGLAQVLSGQRRLEDTLGPQAVIIPVTIQLDTITKMLREVSGPHRTELCRLVAEWTNFAGWLHTAVGKDGDALTLFASAEDLSDDAGEGSTAATAASFRGYLAKLQGRPRRTIRASAAALATPGAHPTQRTYDLLQTAQAYADLADTEEAKRFLDKASDLATTAGDPPPSVYWYTEPFFRLIIGLAQLGIGQYRDAMESLKRGIEEIPPDQRNAEWMNEYRLALTQASERA